MESNREYRVIQLKDLLSDGLVLEDIQKADVSFAAEEFHQAQMNLQKILTKNQEIRQLEQQTRIQAEWKQAKEEIFNLIPFIGERGTGKTSAMCSFASMLKKYNWQQYPKSFLNEEHCHFVVLDTIDSSVLKGQESIMIIILSRMVKYLQKVVNDNVRQDYNVPAIRQEELRKLYREFEDLFSDFLDMEQEKPLSSGGSMIQKLLDLNSSHSMPERFRKLTKLFLEYVGRNDCSCHSRNETQYLVICLDDIDLYNHPQAQKGVGKSAYTLLEQIYEYLQIPGVVVLATYDDQRLLENCQQYIKRKFKDISDPQKQAKAFLHKTVLPRYRIYMPELFLSDYPNNMQVKIDTDALFGINKKKVSPKGLFLNYLGYYYGCYFDSQGQKKHFFEVDTLRGMKNQLDVWLLPKGAAQYEESLPENKLDQRYMTLLSYVYHPFTHERLKDLQERTLFKTWTRMTVSRRSREIFSYIRTELERQDSLNFTKQAFHIGYSYGGLMQALYWSSRKGIFTSNMVHCILASYSIVLPRLNELAEKYSKEAYEQLRENQNDLSNNERLQEEKDCKKYKDAYDTMKQVIGTSIAGMWSNDILYTEFYQKRVGFTPGTLQLKSEKIGSASISSFDRVNFGRIDFTIQDIKAICRSKTVRGGEKFRKFIHHAEIIGMMFTNVRERQREEKHDSVATVYEFVVEKGFEDDLRTYAMHSGRRYACFNILNFVVNSFCWEEYFENLHRDITLALQHHFPNISAGTIRKAIQRCSIEQEFEKKIDIENDQQPTNRKIRQLAFPIQHLDMAYNILKHQHNGGFIELPTIEKAEKFLPCCQKVYQNFQISLAKQDAFYEEVCHTQFAKIFQENPFVKIVENAPIRSDQTTQKNNQPKTLQDLFEDLAKVLISDVAGVKLIQRLIDTDITDTGAQKTDTAAYLQKDPAEHLKDNQDQPTDPESSDE